MSISGFRRYKCITIAEPKFFGLDPVLAAMRPQQATFTRWPSAATRVRALYEGTSLERSVESLTPGQLEALCYEHLRASEPEIRLLLPVGRTLPDIDIYGMLPSGKRIAAQVTHSASNAAVVLRKAEALAATTKAETRVLFAGEAAIAVARTAVERLTPPVSLVAIETVFSDVDVATPWFIDAMLAATSQSTLRRDFPVVTHRVRSHVVAYKVDYPSVIEVADRCGVNLVAVDPGLCLVA